MGGLAHYFEDEGVPTTQISLIREHTEAIKPPRALWVPFELGRPLGVPNDAAFQNRVLRAALTLLEASRGPILDDFPEDAPVSVVANTAWACPVDFSRKTEDLTGREALLAAFRQEVVELHSWYDLAVKRRGWTTVGVSGLDMETIVEFIGSFLDGIPQNPHKDLSPAFTLNFAVDDLKAYYYEAVAAQPGNVAPESTVLDNWFWQETAASKVLFGVQKTCLSSDDKMLQLLGKILLIPASQAQRKK